MSCRPSICVFAWSVTVISSKLLIFVILLSIVHDGKMMNWLGLQGQKVKVTS